MQYNPKQSHRTAISRRGPSRPLRILLEKGLIRPEDRILDFGCGKGADVRYLREQGYDAYGFDPYNPDFNDPSVVHPSYDVVLNFFVLNVLPPFDRDGVVARLIYLTDDETSLYIAVRDTSETVRGRPYKDGVMTGIGTFQHLFTAEELTDYLYEFGPVQDVRTISRRKPLLVEVRCSDEQF